MSENHVVSFSLEINVQQAYTQIRQLETVLYRSLSLLRRMGLSEDVTQAIDDVQRLITWLNSLRLTLIAVQAASGPVGWALAIVGAAGVALTTGEYLYDAFRGASRW